MPASKQEKFVEGHPASHSTHNEGVHHEEARNLNGGCVAGLGRASVPRVRGRPDRAGRGNANAALLASSSGLVQSARQFLAHRIAKIGDRTLAKNVHELVEDPTLASAIERARRQPANRRSWTSSPLLA